jgi:hypothetical protein
MLKDEEGAAGRDACMAGGAEIAIDVGTGIRTGEWTGIRGKMGNRRTEMNAAARIR